MAPNNTVLPEGPYPGETVRSPITGSEAVRLAVTGANYRASIDDIMGAGRPVTGAPFRIPTTTTGLGDSWFSRTEPTASGVANPTTRVGYNLNSEIPAEPIVAWTTEARFNDGGFSTTARGYLQYNNNRPIFSAVDKTTSLSNDLELSSTHLYFRDDVNGTTSGSYHTHIQPGFFQINAIPGISSVFSMDCPSGQSTQMVIAYNGTQSLQMFTNVLGNTQWYAKSITNSGGAFVLNFYPETITGNGPNVCIGVFDTSAQFIQDVGANQTTTVGHVVRGKASHTADLIQVQDSTTAVLYRVRADGSYGNTAVTVSALPSATIATGLRSFVTDATTSAFAATATGGGSSKVPVYSDGTVWRIG